MFKDFSDSKLLNETTIKIDINTTLSLKVEQIFRYDTNPPDGVKKFDSKSTFGLVLTL
jgi:putative salt-induced outer membrane protein YdiY